MEPGTPPTQGYRNHGFPATPSTPRYGSFEDLPEVPGQEPAVYRKPGVIVTTPAKHKNYLSTPKSLVRDHSRPLSALATPRQTPRQTPYRKKLPLPAIMAALPAIVSAPAGTSSSVIQPSERDCELEEQTTSEEEEDEADELDETFDDLLDDLSRDNDSDGFRTPDRSTTNSSFLTKNLVDIKEAPPAGYHPHQQQPPPDMAGVWCVFRGRKIFRPFPPGMKPFEPVTLFEDQLKSTDATAGGAIGAVREPIDSDRVDHSRIRRDGIGKESVDDIHAAHEGAAFDAAFDDFDCVIDSDYETDIEA